MRDDDEFLPVPDAIEDESNHRPHPATCCRWSKWGRVVNGRRIVLQTQMHGGRRKTKRVWVRQFFQALTEATTPNDQQDEADSLTAGERV